MLGLKGVTHPSSSPAILPGSVKSSHLSDSKYPLNSEV